MTSGSFLWVSQIRSYRCPHPLWLIILLLLFIKPATAGDTETDWGGFWHTYWRGDQALMTLDQDGDQIAGTYRPGNGRIEARLSEDGRLVGRWIESGREGGIVAVLSEDGGSFVGRFDNGEYWNGERLGEGDFAPVPFRTANTPRDALRTVVVAMNATRAGRSAATLVWEPLLVHAGPETDQLDRSRRNRLFYQLIDRTTFRIFNAPGIDATGSATFEIQPAGIDWTLPLTFLQQPDSTWKLEVPPLAELQSMRDTALVAAGYPDLVTWERSRSRSPRGVMRRFIEGVKTWHDGGAERALDTMDLSAVPPQVRDVEGEVAADYLIQVLDRVGFVIWQEIPDDPDQNTPYVHFAHAAGTVAIAPVLDTQAQADAPPRWHFTGETVAALPDVYAAAEALPLVAGMTPNPPFSTYFELRQWLNDISPRLSERIVVLENWQWIALVVTLLVSLLVAWGAGHGLSRVARHITSEANAPLATQREARKGFVWPARIMVVGLALLLAVQEFGLRSDVSALLAAASALALVLAAATFLYALIHVAGSWAHNKAIRTPGYIDELLASLATGLIKIAIVIGAIFAIAEVLSLPYEGVIAGLGVGGLALAIAARDTLSNFIGAGILLADRPFKRGDLVEFSGHMATVEQVGLRSTRLRTFDDSLLIVPNGLLGNDIVNNWGRRRSRRVVLVISVTYGTPRALLDSFTGRLRDVYLAQPTADPTLYLGLKGFAASAIEIELWGHFRVSDYEQYIQAQHALIGDIIDLAGDLGVSFAFPTRTVIVANEQKNGPAVQQVEAAS